MLLALSLSPVLVGLPAVIANPIHAAGAPQIAQWTTGKSDRVERVESDFAIYSTPSHCRPHHPSHAPVVVNKTIYEALSGDAKFSKLFKLINLNNATIDLLNSTSSNVTFFAPPNSAFPKRRERHYQSDVPSMDEDGFAEPMSFEDPSKFLLADMLDEVDSLDGFAESMSLEDPSKFLLADMLDEVDSLDVLDEDDDKKERRHKIIKLIVGAVLSYHVIPQPFDAISLGQNSTHATNLTLPEGSLDGEPLRVRVGRAPFSPALSINLFSRVVGPEVFTSNGIVHAISLPLLPPPAIFTGQFGVPSVFSIATSALQRVGLTDELDYSYVPPSNDEDKGSMAGANTVTFFAPSNHAFQRLPVRLRLFLFSPFGHRALKKLLQYHIVPSHAVHSDYIHNATNSLNILQLNAAFSMVPERAPAAGHPECAQFRMSAMRKDTRVMNASSEDPHASSRQPVPRDKVVYRNATEWPGRRPSPPEVEYNVTVVVPTLLENRTHTIVVTKYAEHQGNPRFPHPPLPGSSRTEITVSGGRVTLADLPARNGAVHVIDNLLNPLREHKHHEDSKADCKMEADEWEDWENWLPQWANEA